MVGIGFMGIGALLTFVMMYMRMHFLWWPFHPAGYALAISFAMDYFWFAFFVAWFLKLMILRHGGLRLHRQVAPLFLGLDLRGLRHRQHLGRLLDPYPACEPTRFLSDAVFN